MNKLPKLHNAMWPGLVGKGDGEGQEPPISLERMLQLTAAAEVGGERFDGIDYSTNVHLRFHNESYQTT